MLDRIRRRVRSGARLLRILDRRTLRTLRRRLEETRTLVHLSILLFLPLLIGLVTFLANHLQELSFLLFPPLASGTYTLFAQPESEYASPTRFIGGLTIGAICAWIAVTVAVVFVYGGPPPTVDAPGAAFAVFLTGLVTWVLDLEEASAFSTALLGLLIPPTQQFAYVASVFLSTSIVTAVFLVWRDLLYEQRDRILYESTKGDDRVLVPVRGPTAEATAMLGARLAAAHDAGKVVLLDLVDDQYLAEAERELLEEHGEATLAGPAAEHASDTEETQPDAPAPGHGVGGTPVQTSQAAEISASVSELEAQADRIQTRVGVPCQVVVATSGESRAGTVLRTAQAANCDLVAVPYEERHGALTPWIQELFRGDLDVLVHRSYDGRTDWQEIMVPVRGASDVAHSMVDFATRLAGQTGRVSVCTCIEAERERRPGEEMLADVVETFTGTIETRVAKSSIQRFLTRNAPEYDLVFLGASRDRSAASRLIDPPTFERLSDLEADVAVVDRS